MISIRNTIGKLWVNCPKCNSSQTITDWGNQICKYEKCDKHEFVIEFNLQTATMILQEIQHENLRKSREPKFPEVRPSKPALQKTHKGWILVPQPPTDNPTNWFAEPTSLK